MLRAEEVTSLVDARRRLEAGVIDVALMSASKSSPGAAPLTLAMWLIDVKVGAGAPPVIMGMPGYTFVGIGDAPPPMVKATVQRGVPEIIRDLERV
ncbi:MAG: hypothetical protein RLZZ26_239 [Candidatus Parcubacteria bacterium]|jgi:hypothetical protein